MGTAAIAIAVAVDLPENARMFAFACGAAGVALALLFLASPVRRLRVRTDDEAIEVVDSRGRRRFRLPWREVRAVIASPSTKTCYVDGGSPERALLVPGPGATAPYDIRNKAELFDTILERVPDHLITRTELLEQVDLSGTHTT